MSGGRPPGGGASRGGSPGILPSRPWRVISLNTHSSFLKPVADYSLLILRFFQLEQKKYKKNREPEVHPEEDLSNLFPYRYF